MTSNTAQYIKSCVGHPNDSIQSNEITSNANILHISKIDFGIILLLFSAKTPNFAELEGQEMHKVHSYTHSIL